MERMVHAGPPRTTDVVLFPANTGKGAGMLVRVGASRLAAGAVPLIAVTLLGGSPLPSASAAFPGANGKIAFSSNRDGDHEILVMNADGSAPVNLTNNDVDRDTQPVWSPDGTKIAFTRSPDGTSSAIWTMNADGSAQVNPTGGLSNASDPSWSPDGTRILLRDFVPGGFYEIIVMNADGSGQANLTNHPEFDTAPDWSPDGMKIVFQSNRSGDNEIFVMDADGSDPANLTQTTGNDDQPAWSPDGKKIAFQSERDGDGEIFVMNADGSEQVNLTNHDAFDGAPQWSPDGRKILFTSDRTGDPDVFMMNADGSDPVNLTNNPALEGSADWQRLAPTPKKVSLKAKPKTVDQGEKVRLKARVKPCDGHEGDVVEFYRKKKRIAKKKSNDNCVAKLKVKATRTTKFRAISPVQDLDHLAGMSKPVKVRVSS